MPKREPQFRYGWNVSLHKQLAPNERVTEFLDGIYRTAEQAQRVAENNPRYKAGKFDEIGVRRERIPTRHVEATFADADRREAESIGAPR